MSYDVTFTQRKMVNVLLDDSNHTFNCAPMFYKALGEEGIGYLDGKRGKEVIDYLANGIKHMEENAEWHEQHAPDNGWGSYDSALKWLNHLHAQAIANPRALIEVCK